MTRNGNVTYDKVVDAITGLRNDNSKITVRKVSDRIGGGDVSKISALIKKFLDEEAISEEMSIEISHELQEMIKREILMHVQQARGKDQRMVSDSLSHCSELQELLVSSEQDRHELSKELDAKKVEQAKTAGAYQSEVSMLRERLDEIAKRSADLDTQLTTASEQFQDSSAMAREEIARLQASLSHADDSRTELAEENRQLKTQIVMLEKDVNASQAETRVLRLSLEKLDKQLEFHQEENKQLCCKLERAIADHSDVRETCARLETKLMETERNGRPRERKRKNPSVSATTGPAEAPESL